MTTGRINQVAFLRDVGTAWSSTHRRVGGEAKTGHERRSSRGTKCIASDEQGRDPTPTKRSASESTIEHRCTNAAAPVGGARLGHRARSRSAPWPRRARDGSFGWTSGFHRFRYATQDPDCTPRARWPLGERLKRSACRQFDAKGHGACQRALPFYHSHAHCVRVAASTITGPRPTQPRNRPGSRGNNERGHATTAWHEKTDPPARTRQIDPSWFPPTQAASA